MASAKEKSAASASKNANKLKATKGKPTKAAKSRLATSNVAAKKAPTSAVEARATAWVMKSEPDVFSIDDLAKVKQEPWSGVRNYTARNFMRDQMQVGDVVLFYHSSCEVPGIAGVARVASKPYADPTQFDPRSDYFDPKATVDKPRWQLVDVAFERKLQRVITLDALRSVELLHDMVLLQRGNRLSIMPVTATQLAAILKLEK